MADSQPTGAIDCDIHPAVPNLRALFPYLSDQWRDTAIQRGLHELDSGSYPNNSPVTARADWRADGEKPGASLDRLRRDGLDRFGAGQAICNCLYGVQLLHSEDMAAALARAVNDWMAAEWLDREPRLRASIVVPDQNPDLAVAEIERRASDRRFLQVLLLVSGDRPLGNRAHWPIYAAAQRHGLPIGIHAGGTYRHAPSAVGWPSYYTETYVGQATAFQSQLLSLVTEGVFVKFPDLRFVLLESGITWLPAFLWRLTKFWHGLRMEIPWVDRAPMDTVRDHIRLTLQPFDAPPDAATISKIIDQLGSDELLLYSTDYPHWNFDGDDPLPPGLSPALARKMMIDNPRATYPRLMETLP